MNEFKQLAIAEHAVQMQLYNEWRAATAWYAQTSWLFIAIHLATWPKSEHMLTWTQAIWPNDGDTPPQKTLAVLSGVVTVIELTTLL